MGRIIELSIKASHSGTSTIAAAVSRGVAIDGKKMLSNNTTQRKAISEGQTALSKDDQRKAICKRFFRLMNVGQFSASLSSQFDSPSYTLTLSVCFHTPARCEQAT